jgi:hypothetical protein
MIDTVVLRLSNLKTHHDIYSALSRPGFNTVFKKSKHLDFKEIEDHMAGYVRSVVNYGDTGKEFTESLRGKVHIPSSHYYVAFSINDSKDYIEFNFSIPKYLWGNNVAQFVRSVKNKAFVAGLDYKWTEQTKIVFSRLVRFINMFFENNFPHCLIDYSCLEITRIDLCYNQIFPTKAEAFRYLSYQKKINMRNMRLNSANFHNHETSVMYVGENYSVKIYHKGSEFKKNDAVELRKKNSAILRNAGLANNQDLVFDLKSFQTEGRLSDKDSKQYSEIIKSVTGKVSFFDVDFLQSIADRTLRYEMTFRKNMIGQLYKENSFRKLDPIYQKAVVDFKKLWNETDSGQSTMNLNEQEKKLFKYYLKWKRKTLSAKLVLDKERNRQNRMGGLKQLNQIFEFEFDEATMKAMCKKFRQFMMQFQVKAIDDEVSFKGKIREYNRRVDEENLKWADFDREYRKQMGFKIKKKLSILKMESIYTMLLRYGSWENIKKTQDLPKATFYRYKQDFEMIGMNNTYISCEIFNIETDYREYFDIEIVNYNKIKPKFQ